MRNKLVWITLSVVASFCCLGTAEAEEGGFHVIYGDGYGYGSGVNRFFHSDRQIPYFAEHPPVYYSYPVPRTYGYSPYAYPGWFKTPTLKVDVAPLSVINPHVTPVSAKPDNRTTGVDRPVPRMVFNPYVTASEKIADRRP